MIDDLPNHFVYKVPVIEFVTVVAEFCIFLEHSSDQSRQDFVSKTVKILPLLYLKASMLETPASVFDDEPEKFVTEEDYLFIKEQIEQLLGLDDTYLEVFHPDMALSDTPIAAFVSEDIADIYQEIKDFAANYQLGDVDIMNDALVICLQSFKDHWGQKLLNSLKALHSIKYSDSFMAEDEEPQKNDSKSIDRNSFLNFLHDEEDSDEIENLLK